MELQQNRPLAELTTFRVGGAARWFVEAVTEADVLDAVRLAREDLAVPLAVLGGGSNLLVSDEGFAGLVLRLAIPGVELLAPARYRVGAGENWDALVSRVVADGAAGMECLAGIPGSTGGTPVQNVGAYGQEVAETIVSVRALDRLTGCFAELTQEQCRFRYRQSRFNTEEPGRWIITAVTFQLRPGGEPSLRYADLQRHFADELARGTTPTLTSVADAVRSIRRTKGMLLDPQDPDTCSAGSFFRNPVVPAEKLPEIAAAAGVPEVPHYPAPPGTDAQPMAKLPAAWLLERAGFVKGWGAGTVQLSGKHTLALTNRGGATFADVERAEREIREGVLARFGVCLEREPVVLRD